MRVINLTTHSDFSGCRRQIRGYLLPVVDQLPEIGEFVSLRSDHGIVRSFERIGWSNDGIRELYQIVLCDNDTETEFTTYCVKDCEMDDVCSLEISDQMVAEKQEVK